MTHCGAIAHTDPACLHRPMTAWVDAPHRHPNTSSAHPPRLHTAPYYPATPANRRYHRAAGGHVHRREETRGQLIYLDQRHGWVRRRIEKCYVELGNSHI